MAIGDDFSLDWKDKCIRHDSGTTVYTVNQLFTWIMQQIPQPQNMDDDEVMTAETPTAYTVKDNWWLDIGETSEAYKYLSGGAIQTNGYDATSDNNGLRLLKFLSAGYTNAVSGDIGREVGYDAVSTDTGTLLGYNNTLRYWWVRVDDTGDTFADTANTIDLDDGVGTGTGDLSAASTTGEELFANPFTLGSFPGSPDPQTYIFQDEIEVTEWWARGNIDIVLQVKEAGVQIDSQYITVFARQQGDTFTHYEIQLTASGQNAVPLETSRDILDTSPDWYIFYDNEASGPFTANNIIYHPTAGTATWSAEVVDVTDWGTEGVLGIRGFKDPTTSIADNDAFGDGTTTGNINSSATATLGTCWIAYNNQTGAFATGDVLTGSTSGAKRRIIGDQDDGAAGKLLLDTNTGITGVARKPYYRDFTDTEEILDETTGDADVNGVTTDAVSGYDDITIAFVNGVATHGGTTGTFEEGEVVTYAGGTAILIDDTGSSVTLGNVTLPQIDTLTLTGQSSTATCVASQDLQIIHTEDFNFSQQSAFPYSVYIQGGDLYEAGRPLSELYPYLKFVCQEDSLFEMYKLRQVLKYAYQYNATGTAFTDESTEALDTTASDMNLLSDATEINDAYYFGADEEFGAVYVNVGTNGVGTYTVTWEYYNGAWTALGNVTDNSSGFTAGTGWYYINFDWPTDWTTIDPASDGNTGYYVRARISAWTAITTPPLGTQGWNLSMAAPEEGQEYRNAFEGYAENRASPFGQKLGATFFGAQGVWLEGMDADDANNINLTDADGTEQTPYQSITVTMSSVESGVTVFITRASAGAVEYYLTSTASGNNQGDTDFVVQEAIAVDTPTTGVVKVLHADTGLDHRYRFASWATSTFTFPTKVGPFACTGGGTATALQDTVNDFTALDMEVGDVIRNETDVSWAHVVEITDADNVVTTPLTGGTLDVWTATDNYSLHTLVVTYDGSDLSYAPYIDDIATATSIQVIVLYAASRSVLAKARKAGKKPFSTTGQLNTGGYSVAAIIPDEPQYNL